MKLIYSEINAKESLHCAKTQEEKEPSYINARLLHARNNYTFHQNNHLSSHPAGRRPLNRSKILDYHGFQDMYDQRLPKIIWKRKRQAPERFLLPGACTQEMAYLVSIRVTHVQSSRPIRVTLSKF